VRVRGVSLRRDVGVELVNESSFRVLENAYFDLDRVELSIRRLFGPLVRPCVHPRGWLDGRMVDGVCVWVGGGGG
jgi:hypothetical protein